MHGKLRTGRFETIIKVGGDGMVEKKCIRSFRVAQLLMERGHVPVGTERSRRSHGYNVFIFANTAAFDADFEEIMREIAQTN